jgi:hypothetical protein
VTVPVEAGAPQPATSPAPEPPPPATPAPSPEPYPNDGRLRFNEIQCKGSHNSYHLRPLDNPDPQWQYDLPTLTDQLARFGVRAVELDLHVQGGVFLVSHLLAADPRSTCPRLTACLRELRGWSEQNPGHAPLVVWLELRDEEDPEKLIDHLGELDRTLADAWPRERVFTPDDMAGPYADVRAALYARGWPTVGTLRGKAIFVMLAFGAAPYQYAWNGNGLWGRRMFVTATDTTWRHAVFLAMDAPFDEGAQIRDAVARGFIVRTRSDDLPDRGRDFWGKRAAALNSGAQMVLTDYPDPQYIPGYAMDIPGGTPARCNPLTAPPWCTPGDVEHPLWLQAPP